MFTYSPENPEILLKKGQKEYSGILVFENPSQDL